MDIPKTDRIDLPLSYKDKVDGYMQMVSITTLKKTDFLKPDLEKFLIRNLVEYVYLIRDDRCILFNFDTFHNSEKHAIALKYFWRQETSPEYYTYDKNISHGDLSVISGFEFAAWYMNAPFDDCISVVKHIMQYHCGAFLDELNKMGVK